MEPGKAAMEGRSRRKSRGARSSGSRPVPTFPPPPMARPPAASPRGAQLWLFPSDPRLLSTLLQKTEVLRQMSSTRGRLAVLESGGASVEVHQLPARSDGARKPSE